MATKVFLILLIAVAINLAICTPAKTSEKLLKGIDSVSDKIDNASNSAKNAAKKGMKNAKKGINSKTNSLKKTLSKRDTYAVLPDEELSDVNDFVSEIYDEVISKHYPAIRSLLDDVLVFDQQSEQPNSKTQKTRSLLDVLFNEEPEDKPQPKGKRNVDESDEESDEDESYEGIPFQKKHDLPKGPRPNLRKGKLEPKEKRSNDEKSEETNEHQCSGPHQGISLNDNHDFSNGLNVNEQREPKENRSNDEKSDEVRNHSCSESHPILLTLNQDLSKGPKPEEAEDIPQLNSKQIFGEKNEQNGQHDCSESHPGLLTHEKRNVEDEHPGQDQSKSKDDKPQPGKQFF